MKKCEKCGAENTDTLAFCTNCGAPLLSNPAPTAAPEPESTAVPEAPIPDATTTEEAPASAPETPAVSAPEPMPAPTAETTTPVNPEPSTIPTPTPVKVPDMPAKKNNKMLTIILIAAVAIIGIIVAVVMIVSNNNSDSSTTNTPAASVANNTETEEVSTVITSSTVDGTNVTLGDYQIVIPKAYDYKISDGTLYLGDISQTWMATITYVADTTYSNIESSLEAIAEEVTNGGATVLESGTDTADGVEYYYIDSDSGEFVTSLGLFKAPNDATFMVYVTNGTTVADHGLLGAIAPIVENAKEVTADSESGIVKIGNGLITNIKTEILDAVESTEE